MAYHLLSSNGTAQNENKFRTQKPTPFNDPGTVPVRLASVPFERRNEPINVMFDEPPKPRPRASIVRTRKRIIPRNRWNNRKAQYK